ncbi:GntR family transcriptional regulator [Dietzia maris]|uniref:GntR family transcriptional regulator n=1 Tax=Dietzia maris TaxID=37915 RepID=UPI00223C1E3B|nr:GntR family transcriptional regulator [Dietzia maris]MCT1433500.1 GntR family transcriptional regulator [Dietzia maris]MCT1520564.1 GntR family transcriptional regulator [Dietzia maris]
MSEPRLARSASVDFSLAKQVMEYVRAAVISGDMNPGELYSVYRLAEVLQVSRSPVREGLLRLEEAGLIRFERNRGFRVVPTTPSDVAEIFSIRIALEVPAARRAAQAEDRHVAKLTDVREGMREAARAGDDELFFELDRELHDAILAASGARRAREVVERLRISTRLLGASTVRTHRGYEDICREHDPIVDAIIGGDSESAGRAMESHLVSTGQLLVAQVLDRTGEADDAAALWERLTEGYLLS